MSHSGEDPLETCEEWDVTIPRLPPRSRLYRLKPVGIGTPYVEGLTSYIVRLAREHLISVFDLARQEVFPLFRDDQQPHQRFVRIEYTINGANLLTYEWVSALNVLTSRDDLEYLTFISWSDIIAGSLRSEKAWCPICYNEQRSSHSTIYDPLFWSVKDISICPVHGQPLSSSCPNCHRSITHLASLARPGYCSYCRGWLGERKDDEIMLNDDWAWQSWSARSIVELISATPTLRRSPRKETFVNAMSAYLRLTQENNFSKLAREFHVSARLLRQWLSGQKAPRLSSVLKVCFYAKINLLGFLLGKAVLSEINQEATSLMGTADSAKRHLSIFTKVDIRQDFENFIHSHLMIGASLSDVAKKLGYPRKTLLRHCPDLCDIVIKRHFEARDSVDIRVSLEAELTKDICPSMNEVSSYLGCSPAFLEKYYPEYCEKIRLRRYEMFSVKQIKEDLQLMILVKSHSILTIAHLARHYGYKLWKFRRRFPDYCRAIDLRSDLDDDYIRKELETLVSKREPPFPSLEEVARENKCTSFYLKQHFPDLAGAISRKHLKFTNLPELKASLELIAQSEDIPPLSLTDVSGLLGYEVKTLRRYFPEYCRFIVERYRNWSDREEISAYLQRLLESDEYPFPSLVEVAKRVNRSASYLRRRFPECSKQISSNYLRDREQEKNKRIQQRCEEMRQTVLNLHSQGLYPSYARVSNVLPCPGSTRIPEVVATWRNTLSVLKIRKPRN